MTEKTAEKIMKTRRWPKIAASVTAAVAVFFIVLGIYWSRAPDVFWVTHTIDDQQVVVGYSTTDTLIRVAETMLDKPGGYLSNDRMPPSVFLDNTPNFQQGIISALARFAFELTDQIGRTRGSSQADVDLQEASGLLQYSGTKWVFDLSTSIAPTASSEAQYRKAMRSLLSFNARLAKGDAVFERRADNLLATLDRIAADLGSSSAALEHRLEVGHALFDRQADDVFYGVKGRLYAYYLLLRELRQDFDNVIVERELGPAWSKMLSSMAQAAVLQPWVVINGSPDSQFFPSHLGAQGFFLLRARTQLREITNILLK